MSDTLSPLIAFDFDGVISNSIHDSFMTALNSYMEIKTDHRLPLEGPLHSGEVHAFEAKHPDLFHAFEDLIPLANRADDYWIVVQLMDRGETGSVNSQDDFDAIRRSLPREELNRYQDRFYRVRARAREADPQAWIRLLAPFPGIRDALETLQKRCGLAIATAKDRESVDLLLETFDLNGFFDPRLVLDKDFARSKADHLSELHRRTGTPWKDIHFIDDKLSHLLDVRPLGVRPYLAAWGFNTAREHAMALQQGLSLLRLADLSRLPEGP